MRRLLILCSMLCTFSLAQADVTKTLSWQPVTTNINNQPLTNLSGYNVFQRKDGESFGGPVATILAPATHATVTMPDAPMDWHFAVTAFTPQAESQKSAEAAYIVVAQAPMPPGTPAVTASAITTTGVTLNYAPVADGAGGTAKVEIRLGPAPISWGSASAVACPTVPCAVSGLTPGITYEYQAVAYRGTLNVDAVFGALSGAGSVTTLTVPPPPPVAEIFTNVTNLNGALSFEYDRAVCNLSPYVSKTSKKLTGTTYRLTLKCVKTP